MAKLNAEENKLFETVHARHLSTLGVQEKEKYQKEQIIRIERDAANKSLNVYFKNGEWFRYFGNGTWG